MSEKALVVIDLQNDITKNYRDIIGSVNEAIDWAERNSIAVVYVKHNNLTPKTRTFKPGTRGVELVPEMRVVSDNVFVKAKGNALTSEGFSAFLRENGIRECFLAGADATACVRSASYNMAKEGYEVTVLSDCITSYDKGKIDGMIRYYVSKGCAVKTIGEIIRRADA
ncbi:MAG: cysteine hydrolase [Bacilli bacterium]|jgi:nicotinamidase-related amidase|nr:cysteine hydrolase [Bacilli bacterium]